MGSARFEDGINRFSKWCNWISCIAVLVMMGVVCSNVILSLFKMPILGTHEYVQMISSVIVAFGLAYTGVINGHVAVDLVMRRFPERIQAAVDCITTTLTLVVLGLVTWWLARFAHHNFKLNIATETMEIPLYIFIAMISFGFFVLLFVFINDIIKSLAKLVKK